MFFFNQMPGFDEDNADVGEQEETEIDNKTLYEILGVPPQSSKEEVKKAFKKIAITAHPDKGGDPDKFRKITAAYEILSKEESKQMYDKYGEKGLEGGGRGMNFEDLFFGGGGPSQKQQYKKMKPKQIEVKATLEDIYNGKMIKVRSMVKKICEECSGTGGSDAKQCPDCQGKKIRMMHVQLAPGLVTQTMAPCETCQAKVNFLLIYFEKGMIIDKENICKKCSGERIVDCDKEIEVPLERGLPDEFPYQLTGQGDEYPDVNAGDIIAIIKIEPHELFIRKGADLFHSRKISLKEALVGTKFSLKHLDNEIIYIGTRPGEVIRANQIKMIPSRGMPFYKDQMSFGHLFIQFEIEFPTPGSLQADVIKQLAKLLPSSDNEEKIKDNANVLLLEDFDIENTNPNPEGGKKNEEEQDEGQGPRVQCAQQ